VLHYRNILMVSRATKDLVARVAKICVLYACFEAQDCDVS
jgi:hypothetical protein